METVTEIMKSLIEPAAAEIAEGLEDRVPFGNISQMSVAISLKRIADALSASTPK